MKITVLNTSEFVNVLNSFEIELIKANRDKLYVEENVDYTKEFLSYAEENGKITLKAIDQRIFNDYFAFLENERVNHMTGGRLSIRTISKHQYAINNFFRYLHSEKIPVNGIKMRRKKRVPPSPAVALSKQEIEWLYSVTDDSPLGYRDRCMLGLYYASGLRRSEGINLLVQDLDFNSGKIHIRKTKTNRERYAFMSPRAKKHIEDYIYHARELYLSESTPIDILLISSRGEPAHPETMKFRLKALWKMVKERHGVNKPIGLHMLRHSLGTHLYMAKMEIEDIALMLGHKTLEATQLYIHLANQLEQENKN